jgi:glyoxylase-like metal-dependent hydrolase (beta-lactamase superfamily II)
MQAKSNLSSSPLAIKSPAGKSPTEILPGIFAFPPNRDTLGGTAYLIVTSSGNIAIDSPAWNDTNRQFIVDRGGIKYLAITHRGGIGKTATIATEFGCETIIQEQEAYLLPETKVTTFRYKLDLSHSNGLPSATAIELIWTPGHSPGSTCIYYSSAGGVLFTGRHLLPNQQGTPAPLQTAKTFHWQRQLRSVEAIWQQFPSRTPLRHICPGASTGLLRGKGSILLLGDLTI